MLLLLSGYRAPDRRMQKARGFRPGLVPHFDQN
jgi:hypothetical protein